MQFLFRTKWKIHLLLGISFFSLNPRVRAEENWKIHEWGTFTSLQDERGEAIGGINTDDEPVPGFVHGLASFILLRPTELPRFFYQGAPSCHPDVTMRLETPVIYFHPPKTTTNIQSADVRVKFHGGWLTEFYPDASPDAPGLKEGRFQFPHLLSTTESRLEWNHLKIGGDWPLTNTSAHVWTSPRAVETATVCTPNGESEKFLFYRGVAHIDAPLRISRDTQSGELLFQSQLEKAVSTKPLEVRSIWMVDIQRNGQIAFRALPPLSLTSTSKRILAHTSPSFDRSAFSSENLENLKAALRTTLISEGLFADEAQALLNTWELSYFKSPGLRVFFIVPREWSDFYLPLDISQPADINRVMVGRIELVTPDQRLTLQKIAQFSFKKITADAQQMNKNFNSSPAKIAAEWEELDSGRKSLSASIAIPKTYQTYLDLGRFRNALILDQARNQPSEGLSAFISTYRLEAYKPTEVASNSHQ